MCFGCVAGTTWNSKTDATSACVTATAVPSGGVNQLTGKLMLDQLCIAWPGALNQWKQFILDASNATGVPSNVLAACILQESYGNANAQTANPDPRQLPDNGLMQCGNCSFDPG